MENLKLVLICTLCILLCDLEVYSQKPCPNIFKCGDTLIDSRENNKYPTVLIGTQCWLKIYLNETKFINGDSIPHITNNTAWANMTTGAWCDVNGNPGNAVTYGRLYNLFAVNDSRGLCPKGWYVPTYNEWNILFNYLGGTSIAGGALKEAGLSHWMSPNTGATNSSGFTALPAGFRYGSGNGSRSGAFDYFPYDTLIWMTTVNSPGFNWDCCVDYSFVRVLNNFAVWSRGGSVRCIKDY